MVVLSDVCADISYYSFDDKKLSVPDIDRLFELSDVAGNSASFSFYILVDDLTSVDDSAVAKLFHAPIKNSNRAWNTLKDSLNTSDFPLTLSHLYHHDPAKGFSVVRTIFKNGKYETTAEFQGESGDVIYTKVQFKLFYSEKRDSCILVCHGFDLTSDMKTRKKLVDFRDAIDLCTEGLLVVDTLTGTILDWNQRIIEMFDLSNENLTGQPLARFFSSLEPDYIDDLWIRARAARKHGVKFCTRLTRESGELFTCDIVIKTLYPWKRRLHAVVSITDISATVQLMESIQKSRQQTADILGSVPNPILVLNSDGIIEYANQALVDVFPEWLMLKDIAVSDDLINIETIGSLLESGVNEWNDLIICISRVLRCESKLGLEHFSRIINGRRFDFTVRVKLKSEGSRGAIVVFNDITELIRQQELLETGEFRFRNIFNSSFHLAAIFNSNMQIQQANESFINLFVGEDTYELNENLFKFFETRTDAYYLSKLRANIAQTKIDGNGTCVLQVNGVSNEKRTIDFSIRWVYDLSINDFYGIIEGSDVTEVTEAHLANADLVEKLTEAQVVGRVGSWEYYLDTEDLVLSLEAKHILNLDRGTIQGKSIIKTLFIEEDQFVIEHILSISNIKDRQSVEVRMQAGDQVRWFSIKSQASIRDSNMLIGTIQDISGEKRLQIELMRRETVLLETQRLARIGSWTINIDTKEFTGNSILYELLEYYPGSDTVSLANILSLATPETKLMLEAALSKSLLNHSAETLPVYMYTPGGKLKHFISKGNDHIEVINGDRYISGTLQDVTELHTSEMALQVTESYFRALAENAPLIIMRINKNYELEYTNLRDDEVKSQLLGKNVFDLIYPDYKEQLAKRLLEVQQDMTVQLFQSDAFISGIPEGWFKVTLSTVATAAGAFDSWLLLAQNVTVEKSRQQEREMLIDDLSNKNEDLLQFNYIVSHNLRGPVARLIGLSNLLRKEEASQSVKSLTEKIGVVTDELNNLLLDLTKLLSGVQSSADQFESINVKDVILHELEAMKEEIDYTNTVCEVECDDSIEFYTMKSYITSLCYNLISNSLKYRRIGVRNSIRISIKRLENGGLQWSFMDNGKGVDLKRYQHELYGIYKRFDYTTEGKGLGLFMVKRQIEALQGKITVESVVGQGTTFQIFLPDLSKRIS